MSAEIGIPFEKSQLSGMFDNNRFSQIASFDAKLIATYSASQLEAATIVCFCEHQLTAAPATINT